MEKNIISFNDLNKTDIDVIDILNKSGDKEVLEGLELLRKGFKIKPSNDDSGIVLKKKFRYIDPEILVEGQVKRLSFISQDYKMFLENESKNSGVSQIVNITKK